MVAHRQLASAVSILEEADIPLILRIKIDGVERFAAPYHPRHIDKTADALREHLPALRQLGRVAVFVTDGNVSHLIVTS